MIVSCDFHSFVTLRAWRPWWNLLFHITSKWSSFVCCVAVWLCLLRKALVCSVTEHFWTFDHPSSSSRGWTVWFTAIFIDSILLMHEIVKHLGIHLVTCVYVSLLTWRLLNYVHGVQRHHLVITKLTPYSTLTNFALSIQTTWVERNWSSIL